MSTRAGKVRAARITDLAALGELSRLSQRDTTDARSLGLPVAGPPIGVFSLFRFPLGAFTPHDLIYVYDEEGHVGGLLRVERDPTRDEWTIVELDALGAGDAGDIRFRLVQHLLRDAARRGAARLHVACADEDGNVPLLMQAGFARYGEEVILFRPPDARPVAAPSDARTRAERIRPAGPADSVALFRLHRAATPAPVARLEMLTIADWAGAGSGWRVPRSSLTPILRFAAVEVFVQDAVGGGADGTQLDGFVQVGVAEEDQPHYLRVCVRPDADPGPLIRFGLGTIADRASRSRHGREQGVMAPVRTYESPLEHRLEDAGFAEVATVTLLVKETLVRVAEPALVPAIG